MYHFDDDVPQEDREFFGYNTGLPMHNPESSGMLKGGVNILEMPCKEANRSVPYFEEFDPSKGEYPNKYIFELFDGLSQKEVDYGAKANTIDGLEEVPDGIINIKEANKKKLRYKLQINDYSYF